MGLKNFHRLKKHLAIQGVVEKSTEITSLFSQALLHLFNLGVSELL